MMRRRILFTVVAMLLLHSAVAADDQQDASQVVPRKPKWVVEQMYHPAVFLDARRLFSVGEQRTLKRRGSAPMYYNQVRAFDVHRGQTSVQPQIDGRFGGGEIPESLSIASSADSSVVLTAEFKDVYQIKGRIRERVGSVTEFILWDAKKAAPESRASYPDLEFSGSGAYDYLAVSPNGRHAAVWTPRKQEGTFRRQDTLCRFDLSSREIKRLGEGLEFPRDVSTLKVLNDGAIVVACRRLYADDGSDTLVRQTGYHLLTPEGELTLLWKPSYLQPVAIAVSPDSKIIALTGTEGTGSEATKVVFVFDVRTRRKIWQAPVENLYDPGLAFSPDGAYLAIATGRDNEAHVEMWNRQTRRIEKRLEIAPVEKPDSSIRGKIYGSTESLDFSPDGKWLACGRSMGSLGSYLCVWSLD